MLLVLLLLLQVANAQDERDEAVKARDTAERERDAAVSKVGQAAQQQGGWGQVSCWACAGYGRQEVWVATRALQAGSQPTHPTPAVYTCKSHQLPRGLSMPASSLVRLTTTSACQPATLTAPACLMP